MDEPTHDQENQFWDHVADWLLQPPVPGFSPLIDEDIEARLRQPRDFPPHL